MNSQITLMIFIPIDNLQYTLNRKGFIHISYIKRSQRDLRVPYLFTNMICNECWNRNEILGYCLKRQRSTIAKQVINV